jgi:hypothetical protein
VSIPLKSKAFPAALALLLLALGIPQTIDSILWFLTGDTPSQLGGGSPASPDQAEANAALLEKADAWTGDPPARMRAGILRLRLAPANGTVDQKQLQRAIDDLTDGLARDPANSLAWAALSQAQILAGNTGEAKDSLTTSLLLGEHEIGLSLWRCELGLQLWGSLDSDDRNLWNEQVRMAWDNQPRKLADLALSGNGAYMTPIRLALLSDRERLQAFDLAVGRQ